MTLSRVISWEPDWFVLSTCNHICEPVIFEINPSKFHSTYTCLKYRFPVFDKKLELILLLCGQSIYYDCAAEPWHKTVNFEATKVLKASNVFTWTSTRAVVKRFVFFFKPIAGRNIWHFYIKFKIVEVLEMPSQDAWGK